MTKQCIILVRVSTDVQDLTEQEKNLYDFAVRDGYTKDNIIAITDKESAIKLSEEERNGLNRLKENITNNQNIDCVYVWEISRISRQPKVLYSIRDFLIEHKIQLKVYDPRFELLNADYTINENSSLVFALYASMAESEMRLKKSRFARARVRDARAGKYTGGPVKYGYYIDENRNYCIKETEAKVIQLIYNLYLTSNYSQKQIAEELTERGLINKRFPIKFVKEILNFIEYTGKSDKYGLERTYPVIIDNVTFEKARKIAASNNTNANKAINLYFAHGLIICPVCQRKYIANKLTNTYICTSNRTEEVITKKEKSCGNCGININLLDSILWNVAKEAKYIDTINNNTDNIQKYSEEIEVIKQKINTAHTQTNKLTEKKERNNDLYFDAAISKEKYQSNLQKINDEENAIKQNIAKWQRGIESFERLIKQASFEYDNKDYITNLLLNTQSTIDSIENEKLMYDIIHQYIKKVEVSDIEKYKTKKITVTKIDDTIFSFKINIRTKIAEFIADEENNIYDEYPFVYLNRFSVNESRKQMLKEKNKEYYSTQKEKINERRRLKRNQKKD